MIQINKNSPKKAEDSDKETVITSKKNFAFHQNQQLNWESLV